MGHGGEGHGSAGHGSAGHGGEGKRQKKHGGGRAKVPGQATGKPEGGEHIDQQQRQRGAEERAFQRLFAGGLHAFDDDGFGPDVAMVMLHDDGTQLAIDPFPLRAA